MLEEKLLVWRFNRGHTDALREIYERYKVDLVTLATALLANKAEAEDVVHDVFVGFLRSRGKFRLTGSLKAFLATCVANRARNRNRVSRKLVGDDGNSFESVAPEGERPDWAPSSAKNCSTSGRRWLNCRTNNGKSCCCTCAAG
jgi:RNA polymerase sigma-70 factor (ECF subfamily)